MCGVAFAGLSDANNVGYGPICLCYFARCCLSLAGHSWAPLVSRCVLAGTSSPCRWSACSSRALRQLASSRSPPQALIEHVMLWHAVGRAALHLSLKFSIIVVTDWQGVPSLGVTIQPTENPAFKAKHGILDGERQGVVVTKVCLNQHRVAACAVAAQSLTRVR